MLLSLALACSVLTLWCGWRGETLALAISVNQRRLLRTEILQAEALRRQVGLRQLAAVQEVSEAAVGLGTNTVRAVHQGIASIPFAVLESIPLTRGPARIVRALHDSIAGGVYDTITGVNQAVGKGLRTQLGESAAMTDSDKKRPT